MHDQPGLVGADQDRPARTASQTSCGRFECPPAHARGPPRLLHPFIRDLYGRYFEPGGRLPIVRADLDGRDRESAGSGGVPGVGIPALDRRERQRRALGQIVEHGGIVKDIAYELERSLVVSGSVESSLPTICFSMTMASSHRDFQLCLRIVEMVSRAK